MGDTGRRMAQAQDVDPDADTLKFIVALTNLTNQNLELSTLVDPNVDSPGKITDLISGYLEIDPPSLRAEIKGNKAFITIAPDARPSFIYKFFLKAKIVEDKDGKEILEVRIDLPGDGGFYRFRINDSKGGFGNRHHKFNNHAGGRGGRGRGGRGRGDGIYRS